MDWTSFSVLSLRICLDLSLGVLLQKPIPNFKVIPKQLMLNEETNISHVSKLNVKQPVHSFGKKLKGLETVSLEWKPNLPTSTSAQFCLIIQGVSAKKVKTTRCGVTEVHIPHYFWL